ncbi:Agamous-like MADS-box protein AGL61 [Morella rubra]|uniref:Agamous-like MADS-box protein AGL61 n=1 Tax=Morella rubra TaxID=262757 RepID=A0A6A1V6Y2_9ROSI|nr:Agamous-like MADS-box protein AGL61 [Morella rubra]
MVAPKKIKKTTRGRQRIEIKELETKSTKHVTFSKRRAGLFKKASELCVLCGAEMAIIAYSPGQKTYAFGHPSVDIVLDRYLARHSLPADQAAHPFHVEEFNKKYVESMKELEEEKKRLTEIEEAKKMGSSGFLWEEAIDNMGLEELEHYLAAMKEMREKLATKVADQSRMRNAWNMMQPSFCGVDFGGSGNYQLGNHPSCGSGGIGDDVGSSTGSGLQNQYHSSKLGNLSEMGGGDAGIGGQEFGTYWHYHRVQGM